MSRTRWGIAGRIAPWLLIALGLTLLAAAAMPDLRRRAIGRLEREATAMGMTRWWHRGAMALAVASPSVVSAAPSAAPVNLDPPPPAVLAINLASPVWWDMERSFANLAIGATWQLKQEKGWIDAPIGILGTDGSVQSLPPNATLMRMLTSPDTGPGGLDITCRFTGPGPLVGGGVIQNLQNAGNTIRYRLVNRWEPTLAWLTANPTGPGERVSDLDCREAGMPRDALYAPGFLKATASFRVIRFKDWQQTDGNLPRRWADRHRPGGIDYVTADGVPIEDMMKLSAMEGADPWLSIPWNVDDAYVRNMAQLVHDTLPADRKVYVEVANEVWNWVFPVTSQASKEGLAEKLTGDGNVAVQLRLAQKTVANMKIWEQVFADRPRALVRIVATQHGNLDNVKQIFGYPGLLQHVDALASAPYFGIDVKAKPDDASLDGFFRELDAARVKSINMAVEMRAAAAHAGKRYMAYEAGQHVLEPNQSLAVRIQRDDRMEGIYRRYLADWQARVGDVLAIFDSSSRIDGAGAWGLQEHDGQPLSETPKRRAVRAFLAKP
jgi:hypothetical protein